jgi:uncharacterized protein DUF669
MARINFADVPEQKTFDILPAGQYVSTISNVSTREAGSNAKYPGALNIRWEFEITNNPEYDGRKVFDNQTAVENSMWKIKALLDALEFDTDTFAYDDEDKTFYVGEDEVLDLEELVGQVLEIKVGVRPARKDTETGKEYDKQNRVNAFFPHEASDAEMLA